MQDDLRHRPVLTNGFKEVIEKHVKASPMVVDFTFGTGEYVRLLLSMGIERDKIFAFDRDPESVKYNEDTQIKLYTANFASLDKFLNNKFDLMIADLGLSNLQILSNRGFSLRDTNLDMQMGSGKMTGTEFIRQNTLTRLAQLFKQNGVEHPFKIARLIKERKVDSARALNSICKSISTKSNLVHKVMQSIRTEVNQELQSIETLLQKSSEFANEGAIFLVNTFQSNEDRTLTEFLMEQSKLFVERRWKEIKKIKPSLKEVLENSSSRSAKMRVLKLCLA